MRAAVLREPGAPLEMATVHLDDPHRGEIRVRVEAAGVCHSDLHYMTGDLRAKLPAVLGHEGVGVVTETGDGVTRVAPGDRVVFTWRPRCGECLFCVTGRPHLCVVGKVLGTTGGLADGTSRLSDNAGTVHHLMGVSCFAEECVVSAQSVVPIAHDVPTEIAAIAGCAVVTGVGTALNVMRDATAQPVVVIGAGGIGLSAVMGLNVIGAEPIVVIDTVAARLERAREVGASVTVHAVGEDVAEAVADVVPDGAAWALDAVGTPATMEQAFGYLAPTGTLVAVGLGNADAHFSIPINALVQQERRVRGSLYGSANPSVDLPRVLALYAADRLPLDTLIGSRYPLTRVNQAYADLASGSVGRAILVPGMADD